MNNTILYLDSSQARQEKTPDLLGFLANSFADPSLKILKVLLGRAETQQDIYPSQFTIAKEAGISRSSVQRHFKALEDNYLVARTQECWNKSYKYHLHQVFQDPKFKAQLKRFFAGFMTIAVLISPLPKRVEAVLRKEVNLFKNQEKTCSNKSTAGRALVLEQRQSYTMEVLTHWQDFPSSSLYRKHTNKKRTFAEFEAMIAYPKKGDGHGSMDNRRVRDDSVISKEGVRIRTVQVGSEGEGWKSNGQQVSVSYGDHSQLQSREGYSTWKRLF